MFDIPDNIKNLIHEEMYSIDDVGMSDSTVFVFNDKILKIQTISEEAIVVHTLGIWRKN